MNARLIQDRSEKDVWGRVRDGRSVAGLLRFAADQQLSAAQLTGIGTFERESDGSAHGGHLL